MTRTVVEVVLFGGLGVAILVGFCGDPPSSCSFFGMISMLPLTVLKCFQLLLSACVLISTPAASCNHVVCVFDVRSFGVVCHSTLL